MGGLSTVQLIILVLATLFVMSIYHKIFSVVYLSPKGCLTEIIICGIIGYFIMAVICSLIGLG